MANRTDMLNSYIKDSKIFTPDTYELITCQSFVNCVPRLGFVAGLGVSCPRGAAEAATPYQNQLPQHQMLALQYVCAN